MYHKSGDDGQIYVFRLVEWRGRTKQLPNYSFEYVSGFPCDSMSAESTDKIPSEISRPFAMLCAIQSAVCIRGTSDLCESGSTSFPTACTSASPSLLSGHYKM